MSKYLTLAKVYLSQYLVYRLSFVLWRFRVILSLLLTYFLWTSVYANRLKVFTYTQDKIMSYILLIYFIGDLVYSSRTADLASQIRNGEIINHLLRPFSFMKALFTREMVDKLLNVVFSVVEIGLLIFLLKPGIFIQTNIMVLALTVVAALAGIAISFFISFAISLIAFWSAEVWAPRFVFFVLITVLAGSYFPLDILPKAFYQFLLFTPFPYFAYLPTKIFVEGFSAQSLWMTVGAWMWVFICYLGALALWRKGIKEFSFFGR